MTITDHGEDNKPIYCETSSISLGHIRDQFSIVLALPTLTAIVAALVYTSTPKTLSKGIAICIGERDLQSCFTTAQSTIANNSDAHWKKNG